MVAQAVHKLGAVNWEKISELLENHPVIEGRPKEWFDATTVEAYYVGLMTEIGINVYVSIVFRPAPDPSWKASHDERSSQLTQ